MSLIPAFKIGLWNAWIFILAGMFFHALPPFLISKIIKGDYKKRFSERESPTDVYLNITEKRISTLTIVIFIFLFIYSIFLPLQLGTAWFYTGLVVFLLGVTVYLINIAPWVTTPIDEPVTTGLYYYSRHPIYLTILVQLIGVGIASASWLFLLLTIVLIVVMNIAIIPEERGCIEKYGDAYREYMNKTPRWIGIPKSEKK
jgi:protein-S-isoprenylcysteine O-methyltransferase Ste14